MSKSSISCLVGLICIVGILLDAHGLNSHNSISGLNRLSPLSVVSEGPVSGTWTCANSPYMIHGNVWIPDGKTLRIEACVEIIFYGHFRFDVYGCLDATGTLEEMITFKSSEPDQYWNGIRFFENTEENDTSRLSHCTIQNAWPDGIADIDKSGGGIAILRTDKVSVRHCVIKNNFTSGSVATGGAGIGIAECSPEISHNLIYENSALGEGHGGGILLHKSRSVIQNNIIHHNQAGGGGGIAVIHSVLDTLYQPLIINNTITYNEADHGGGIDFALSSAWIVNSIIYFNKAEHGNQIHFGNNSYSRFYFSDIEDGYNGIGTSHTNTPPAYIGAYEHNMESDPSFIWPPYDFGLRGTDILDPSPCIETGIDSLLIKGEWIFAPVDDYFCAPRPSPGTLSPDMGAIEYNWPLHTIMIPNSGESDHIKVSPNPLDEEGIIQYRTVHPGRITVEVVNADGRLVQVLADYVHSKGTFELQWQTVHLQAGEYFIRCKTPKGIRVIKCLVVH